MTDYCTAVTLKVEGGGGGGENPGVMGIGSLQDGCREERVVDRIPYGAGAKRNRK